jgi:MraZ protein
VFRGVNQINMDAKGRLAIPARYREEITEECAGKLVLTIDAEDKCLLLYPIDEWEKIQAKLDALPSLNKTTRRLQRLLVGHATDVEMDGNGRILVSSVLRDYANLDKKVMLVGQGRKFEMWDEDTWNDLRTRYLEEDDDNELPEMLQNLSL